MNRDGRPEGSVTAIVPKLVDAYPMAQLQLGMVYEMERDQERLPYHNVHTLRMAGRFDEPCFRDAVARVVARHPILRTSFALVGFSEPMQLVYDTALVPLALADLRGRSDDEVRATLSEYLGVERRTPLDTTVAPLCRMGVHVLADDAFQLTITDHHAILDGWSLATVVAEVMDLYRRLLAGERPVPASPRSTYRDFIAAERQAMASVESRDFWLRRLAEIPDCRLPRWPADREVKLTAEPAAGDRHVHDESYGYGSLISGLPPELAPRLRELARQCRVPLKAVLLAAHVKVMSLVTGSADVVVGLTANGRLEDTDGAEVCGLFVNAVPFRMELPDGSWSELVRAVFESENELLPHRRYPMGTLQRELGGSALFETSFVYTDFRQIDAAVADNDAVVEAGEGPLGEVSRTHFGLVVTFGRQAGADGLVLELEYDAREFPVAQIRGLRDYAVRVLAGMVADPQADHQRASLLGAAERELLESWNANAVETPASPVHRLVEERVAASPDAVALVCGNVSLTYRELNARANRLARRLRELGVGADTAVGVCVGRSTEMVVGWLAVLKAGGMYVALDPAFPAARLEFMLKQSDARVVLTAGDAGRSVPSGGWRVVTVDAGPWTEDAGDADDLPGGAGPDNACYVVFTSGSTGLPKGVVTRHRNVAELLNGGEVMTVLPDDTVLQIAPASFDVSTFEVWAPLVGGARLVLAPAVQYGPAEIADWVAESGVTVLHATASLFALLVDHEPQVFDGLRRVLTGSETVSPAHVERVLERCPNLEVVNCWGPTETTTFSVCGSFRPGEVPSGPLPLGVPLANTQVWVLDGAGLPVPVGSPGELYVSGPCLARGYLGRADLTAERFLPHLVQPGERLYRTGDRGRWAVDGRVEFLGRTDHMVKVRGYRVELGEVESVLRGHPGVRECVVVTRANTAGGVDLVAYLVAHGEAPTPGELRGRLGRQLPPYMVPRLFVFMDALPLTPNAKVDRRALPDPERVRPDVAQEFVAPVGELEELLAGIWCRVLGVDRVGRHDNYFDLGGDSIRSIQVLGEVREAGLAASLVDLLANPSLAGLAAVLREVGAEAGSEPFGLVPDGDRDRLPDGLEDAFPMAELQVGMVYEMERNPALNAYHNVETVRLPGRFDEACFRDAVARVVARHPVLRASFDLARYSEPMQLVHASADVPFTVADLRAAAADERRGAVREYIAAQQRAGFDLSRAPLCRMGVHVLSDDAFQWTITEHHAILDGWSMVATVSEIVDTYHRLLAGERATAEPLRSVYRDFIAAERAALGSAETREFWRDQLTGTADGRLPQRDTGWDAVLPGQPVDGEQHRRDEAAGHGILTTPLPPELLRELEAFAVRAAVPVKTAVLAAHMKAINLLTGSADVLIGLTANGRLEEADGAEARGLFLNTVPLRLRLPGGSWQELAGAVLRAERELLPHRRYPMAALQREFGGAGPLFETSFTYNNFHRMPQLAEDGAAEQAEAELAVPGVARTNFALDVTVSHEPGVGGLLLEIDYALQALTPGQVTRLRDCHLRVLSAMVRDPGADHRAAPLLGDREEALLAGWQGADAPVFDVPVHEVLRGRVGRWPGAVAVECADEQVTFTQLDVRSEVLARRLVAAGVRRGDVVGLHLPPGVDALVAVWGVWKAGGAFLPLDPELPTARLGVMLEDARPVVVVSRDVSAVPGSWPGLTPDATEEDAAGPGVVLPRVGARDLAYVMYTSGSTGRPKGVMIEHGSLANYAEALLLPRLRAGGIGEHARVLTGTSAFISDFFLEQILPLLDGHRLLVLSGREQRDPRHLVERAQDPDRAVDIIDATTSQVQLMVEAGLLDAPYPPRVLTTSGEACPPDLWRALRSRPGLVAAHNTYGPAETAVDATFADIAEHASPVIGRPDGNVRVYLVDEGLGLVPPGSVGEIVIGGPGVGRGYVGRPGATAAVFVPDPWGEPGGRVYRTGDLGRYTAEGQIEFLGRNDHQVKILGQRVELEEVEAALRGHPGIEAAAVSADHGGGQRGLRLVAHVVMAAGAALDREEVRGFLAVRLPAAAVPAVLVPLPELPVTVGGKLDRKALTVPDDVGARLPQRELVAPRTESEQRITDVWRQLLGVDDLSVHDDFFALGGHSLLAVRLAMRVSAESGVELPLHEVFAQPTIAGQAELVDSRSAEVSAGPIPLVDRELFRVLPASHAQERQWFLWQLAPDSPMYHVAWAYEVLGGFDATAFGASVDAMIERHEPLRTTLHVDADGRGRVAQRIGKAWSCGLVVSEVAEADLPGVLAGVERRPFDLSAGPVLRVSVWRVAPGRHVVLFVAHHVAVDEWSVEVFERELWALYRAGGDAVAAGLPPLAAQYTDYAFWHRELVGNRVDEDLAYWRRTLDGAVATRLPHQGGRADGAAYAGAGLFGVVPVERLAGLDRVRAQAGATDFVLYLAVYCLFLARRSGEREVTVGVPVSGRTHRDLAPLVGFFVNTLALRVTMDPEEDFPAYLRRVRGVVLEALAHQDAPFEQVVRAVAPGRGDGVNPLFGTMFSFTAAEHLAERLDDGEPAGLTLRDLQLEGASGAKFELSLSATRMPDGLHLGLEFSTAAFDTEAAQEMLACYTDLLDTLRQAPDTAVARLLRASEREQEILAAWQAAVPEQVEARPRQREPVAPRTETEQRIAAVWQSILGVPQIGVYDDFFAVGGHSLLAVRLAMRVSAESGVELPLHEVFAQPTIAGQAELVDSRSAEVSAGPIPLVDRELFRVLPASHAQERQWFLWQLAPTSPVYNVPWGYDIVGDLDLAVLAASVDAMIERHEPLRTTLHVDAGGRGQVVQRVGAAWSCGLVVSEVAEADLPGVLAGVERRPFDLSAGPVLRVSVWRVAPGRHVVLFVAHHVAVDEWSVEVFERELWALYRAGGDAVAAGLPPLAAQYTDYAFWHRELVGNRVDEDLAYWRRTLDGATAHRTLAHTAGGETVAAAGELFGVVPVRRLAGLDRVRAQAGATDFMLYLAVYCLFLARCSGEWEVTVGVPVSGRTHRDLAPLVGFFVNTLALRVTMDPEEDFPGYLRRVREVVLEAFAHQDAPFEQVVRAVAPGRGDGVNPLFGTMFSFTAAEHLAERLDDGAPAGLTLRDLRLEGASGAKFELSLSATRMPDGLHLGLEFSTAAFDTEAAQEMLACYTDLLDTLRQAPDTAVARLLRASEREQQVLAAWRDSVPEQVEARLPEREPVAPRTETEQRIAAVWRQLLGVDEISVHDDFFALGGHSLLAVRLGLALSGDFATEVPLAELYTTPTVAGQAERLEASELWRTPVDGRVDSRVDGRVDGPGVGRSVVPLGGARDACPLVLAHPLGGTLFCYRELLGEVESAFEAFGVQGDFGEAARAGDFAALAGRYADELVPVLGGRSPVVAGWSAGGVLAHELARALTDRGVRVRRLVLIDSDPRPVDDESYQQDIAALDALRDQVVQNGAERLAGSAGADRLFATLGVDPAALAALDGATVAALMAFWRGMLVGLAAHRPTGFDGPAELVVAGRDDGPDTDRPVIAAWRDLAATLGVGFVDADHFQLLRRPWVKAVADVLHSAIGTGETGI